MRDYMLKVLLGWSYEGGRKLLHYIVLYTHWMSVNNC